jgi:2-polyprenyl-3-methyl-5-hydroxy-6-metoxy-1,4-benzoquinol methylase
MIKYFQELRIYQMAHQAYDYFSSDYDKFVNWQNRLAFELPFISNQISSLSTKAAVLDAACGTGKHAIALKNRGFDVVGADISAGMVEKARQNASMANVKIRFEKAGFGELASIFGKNKFDAVLCLGNSLPHVLTEEMFRISIEDFAQCLRPGGLLLIQNRNFDLVMMQNERWMEPQSYQEGSQEWLFLRLYDFLRDGTIQFNVVTLTRSVDSAWRQSVTATKLRPWSQDEVNSALVRAEFGCIQNYGDMTGASYDRLTSGNLVITANKIRSL